jgi:hypothetical protein
MKSWGTIALVGVVLSGCVAAPGSDGMVGEPRVGGVSSDIAIRPRARPDGFLERVREAVRPPPPAARTQEQFDTTTVEQREAALETPVAGGERALGRTIASLGSPTEPGFWLKTPLVTAEGPGRVVYPTNGKSVQVTLIPIEGPATAGSRMSLAALRLLEAPLTGLPEVEVYSGG